MKKTRSILTLAYFLALVSQGTVTLFSQRVSLVSINRQGTATANNQSRNHKISADGRYVVFESEASDLVSQDNNGVSDVFRYDLVTGSMRLVSITPSGTSGNGPSYGGVIDSDGSRVVFTSEASDLLSGPPGGPADTNGAADVFIKDFPPQNVICIPLCTSLVSVNRDGTASANANSHSPSVSEDGSDIAFRSNASDLTPGTPPASPPEGFHIYRRSFGSAGSSTRLITVPVRAPVFCPAGPFPVDTSPVISPNGVHIAFTSFSNSLTSQDDPCDASNRYDPDVFVYDRISNLITLASRSTSNNAGNGASERPLVTNDGTVAFHSRASDLVSNDNNGQQDVFVFRGSVTLVSVNLAGTGSGGAESSFPSISRDGRRVAFQSNAADLVGISDTNGVSDIFVRDLNSNTTTLVSINRFGTGTGGRFSQGPAISANGRMVAFHSEAIDLVGGPTIGGGPHIFARDLTAGRTKMLSVNRDETGGCNFPCLTAAISRSGNTVAFDGNATNLITLADANAEAPDIFAARQSRKTSDFDEDGRTDLALWRPSNNTWWFQLSANNGFGGTTFGTTGDIPVPADYDGDGTTDVAVFRPSTGVWYVLNSSDNFFNFRAYQFGISGDVPVAADYSADGRAELAVFRPATGVWYVFNLVTSSFTATSWGLSGDIPVPVDYFGDGRADLAVFRPSSGVWYIVNSSTGNARIQPWGLTGDKPVAADYDGDERADIAVWRPSTGVWYVLRSSNNSPFAAAWGISGDIPQPGDYDGDWRADFAVWRPASGVWYVLQSSNGAASISTFGQSGDQPVASAYKIE